MEHTNKKIYFLTGLWGVLPEIIFAWIIGNILDIAVWKAWLWIQGFSIVSSALRTTFEYVAYRYIWRNSFVNGISESLLKHDYPNPRKYQYDTLAEHYFNGVMNDEELEISTRLDAAYMLGSMNVSSARGLIQAFRIDSFTSAAINRFHQIKYDGKEYKEKMPE
ncbi:MAG TPA: hypothetical protein PLV78_11490 [Deltaproteobacteria bacterium]|nr:hypothetical protein [Deltaproteobacteria bacterium]